LRFATPLAIDFILDLFKNASRDILCYVLGVEGQHPDLPLPHAQKVNDPESSALATAGDALAHLAHASGAGTDRTGFGIGNKRLLELRIFIVAQIFPAPRRVNSLVSTKLNMCHYTALP
jgi:hypothetical protein